MIKWAMLWHRFRCSLSTTAAGANHMCKSLLVTVQVFVHFRRVTSFSCANAWMTTSIDRSNGGCNRLPLGSKLFHFHAVLGKKNCKVIPIWELAHPPWENSGYITLVYLVQGFEYEKIALLVGGSFSKHGHHQIPCLCNTYYLWPVSLVVPVLSVLCPLPQKIKCNGCN